MQHNAHVAARRFALKGKRNGYGKTIVVGAVTYKSLAAFAKVCQKKSGLDYMTVYMRLRAGMSPQEAMSRPARVYRKVGQQLELAL